MAERRGSNEAPINPLGKDESGDSEIVPGMDEVGRDAANTTPTTDSAPDDGERIALRSEDGDLFLNMEDDVGY
jgi:hypothetical protein